MELIRQLAAGIGLLTRLPVWRVIAQPPKSFAASIWSWPVVGALIGFCGGLVYAACQAEGISVNVAVCWTLLAQLMLTGALHEDGLADTADGFFGGRTRERKLEIMRDSRIGTFGTLALLISTALRAVALVNIASPHLVMIALVISGCLARSAILLVAASVKPARNDGLASGLKYLPYHSIAGGLAFALLLTLALRPSQCILLLIVTISISFCTCRWTINQIGGHTGDLLGATAVLTEVMLLTVLSR